VRCGALQVVLRKQPTPCLRTLATSPVSARLCCFRASATFHLIRSAVLPRNVSYCIGVSL
jgi:hypothetical protein